MPQKQETQHALLMHYTKRSAVQMSEGSTIISEILRSAHIVPMLFRENDIA
jgi:hypothetical protein